MNELHKTKPHKAGMRFPHIGRHRNSWYRIPANRGTNNRMNGVRAAETPFSDQELEMQQLWGEMRKDFQTSAGETDEAALSRAIGKRMGIPTSKVTLPYRMLEDVPQELIDAVKPAPGLTPPNQ